MDIHVRSCTVMSAVWQSHDIIHTWGFAVAVT